MTTPHERTPTTDYTLVGYVGGYTAVLEIPMHDLLDKIKHASENNLPLEVTELRRKGKVRRKCYLGYPNVVHMRECDAKGE